MSLKKEIKSLLETLRGQFYGFECYYRLAHAFVYELTAMEMTFKKNPTYCIWKVSKIIESLKDFDNWNLEARAFATTRAQAKILINLHKLKSELKKWKKRNEKNAFWLH